MPRFENRLKVRFTPEIPLRELLATLKSMRSHSLVLVCPYARDSEGCITSVNRKEAEKHPGAIHLLLTDVVMPEMNGRDLLERIQALRPAMRSMFMSGYTADVIAHHGVLDKGMWFIQKPFTGELLAEKVREVLDQG